MENDDITHVFLAVTTTLRDEEQIQETFPNRLSLIPNQSSPLVSSFLLLHYSEISNLIAAVKSSRRSLLCDHKWHHAILVACPRVFRFWYFRVWGHVHAQNRNILIVLKYPLIQLHGSLFPSPARYQLTLFTACMSIIDFGELRPTKASYFVVDVSRR